MEGGDGDFKNKLRVFFGDEKKKKYQNSQGLARWDDDGVPMRH